MIICKDCTEIYCPYRDEEAMTACYYENFAEPFTFIDDKDVKNERKPSPHGRGM